jgi:chemotaxis protein CheZ
MGLGLIHELENLAGYIRKVRSDLASICPDSLRTSHIPRATDQLDAVIAQTEAAATQILDACDTLESVGRDVSPEAGQRISDAVTTIYEACGFQDLTGQRIVTVTHTLGYIESKLSDLMAMLGISPEEQPAAEPGWGEEATPSEEQKLLNGPQLPGQAIDQSEIDKLLADF